MSDTVNTTEKAIDLVDKYMDSVVNAIEEGVETYGPAVVDTGLWIVRIDNIQSLMAGFIFVALFATSVYFSRFFYKKAKKEIDTKNEEAQRKIDAGESGRWGDTIIFR